jgi:hypothetical protein
LELARLGSLELEQAVNFQDIFCTKPLKNPVDGSSQPLAATSEFDEPAGDSN